jgi:TetR/AcrR family transcriptional regulator, lmrAB and yxaGH operons repressor
MGMKGEETRGRLLDATQSLVESGGYSGAGLNQVLEVSHAPRGSLYFHFPGGKDQLVAESVARAGTQVEGVIRGLEVSDAKELVDAVLGLLGDRLEASGWQSGCPVATVALEVAAVNDAVQQVCSSAYRSWERALRDGLVADRRQNAEDLSVTVLALIEGALILARTHRSREPLEQVRRTIAALL